MIEIILVLILVSQLYLVFLLNNTNKKINIWLDHQYSEKTTLNPRYSIDEISYVKKCYQERYEEFYSIDVKKFEEIKNEINNTKKISKTNMIKLHDHFRKFLQVKKLNDFVNTLVEQNIEVSRGKKIKDIGFFDIQYPHVEEEKVTKALESFLKHFRKNLEVEG